MKRLWSDLSSQLKISNPRVLAALNPPAKCADIDELERKIGLKLPSDFLDCLLIHDGQNETADGVFSGLQFLSCRRILDEWFIWSDLYNSGDFDDAKPIPDNGVKSVWWSPGWIPFSYNGNGDHLCLDLDPASTGESGQIITLWHDDGHRKIVAKSFFEWFYNFVYGNQ